MNQEFIIAHYCKNIDEPEKMCSGFCYYSLNVQIEKEKAGQYPALNNNENHLQLYVEPLSSFYILDVNPLVKTGDSYKSLLIKILPSSFFRPPKDLV